MRLPDFLGIGALKAGTTYLDGLLRTHPELCLPGVKELDFFTRHYEKGTTWYARKFAGCGPRRAGEVSPQYLADDQCPARINELLPDALLLASVRDPVQRAYSQYKHWVQVSAYRGDFEQFLDDHPNAIEAGRYYLHVSRYLDLFQADRLHVVVFEDLVSDPVEVMQGVFRFLGVDARHTPPALEAANVSTRPRFHRAYVPAKRASGWLHDHGSGQIVDWAKRAGAARVFRARSEESFAPLTPAAAALLAEVYRDDVGMLSNLLGRNLLTTWMSVNAI